jgi:hypothetical protein
VQLTIERISITLIVEPPLNQGDERDADDERGDELAGESNPCVLP